MNKVAVVTKYCFILLDTNLLPITKHKIFMPKTVSILYLSMRVR